MFKNDMKANTDILTFLRKAIVLLVASIVVGILLMWIAYMVPAKAIAKNMPSTAETMEAEGITPNFPSWCFSPLNNWTDSIMLLNASYSPCLTPLKESMYVSRFQCNSSYPNESLVNQFIYQQSAGWIVTYSRYWHGYLAFLKPLLAITDLSGIRILNGIVQISLIVFTLILLKKVDRTPYILPYVLSIICLRILALFKCLTYSQVFYVFSIGCILVLLLYQKKAALIQYELLFLFLGILTSFFDLLTYPIVSFFIPVTLYLNLSDKVSFKDYFVLMLKLGTCWLAGYILMWVGKWIVGSIITGENMIIGGLQQIQEDTGSDVFVSLPNLFYVTVRDFAMTPFIIPGIVYAGYLIITIIKNKSASAATSKSFVSLIAEYALIALFPFFYFMVMQRHTAIHHGLFSNKVLVISVYAALSVLTKIRIMEKEGS